MGCQVEVRSSMSYKHALDDIGYQVRCVLDTDTTAIHKCSVNFKLHFPSLALSTSNISIPRL